MIGFIIFVCLIPGACHLQNEQTQCPLLSIPFVDKNSKIIKSNVMLFKV